MRVFERIQYFIAFVQLYQFAAHVDLLYQMLTALSLLAAMVTGFYYEG